MMNNQAVPVLPPAEITTQITTVSPPRRDAPQTPIMSDSTQRLTMPTSSTAARNNVVPQASPRAQYTSKRVFKVSSLLLDISHFS